MPNRPRYAMPISKNQPIEREIRRYIILEVLYKCIFRWIRNVGVTMSRHDWLWGALRWNEYCWAGSVPSFNCTGPAFLDESQLSFWLWFSTNCRLAPFTSQKPCVALYWTKLINDTMALVFSGSQALSLMFLFYLQGTVHNVSRQRAR